MGAPDAGADTFVDSGTLDLGRCTTEPSYLDGSVGALPLSAEADAGALPTNVPPGDTFVRLVFHGPGQASGLLRGDGDTFSFTLDTVAGYDTSGSTDDYLLLDDRITSAFVAGVEQTSLHHEFSGRVSSVDFELRGVAPGLHKLIIMRSVEDPSVPAGTIYRGHVLTPGGIFAVTLARDQATWAGLMATDGTVAPTPSQFWQRDVRQDSPTLPLHGGPDASGHIGLRLGLCTQPEMPFDCGTLQVWSGLVIFLDGVPRPVGGRDLIAAPVTPAECTFVDVDVDSLPVDGQPHRLDIVHLSGLRSPTFLELGGPLTPYGSGGYTSVGVAW